MREAGYDVIWAGEWGSDPGDPEILRRAVELSRVLVTLDADFSQLVYERRVRHSGVVWLRNVPPPEYVGRTVQAVETFSAELEAGGLVVVRKGKMRLRPFQSRNA